MQQPLAETFCPHTLTPYDFHIRSLRKCACGSLGEKQASVWMRKRRSFTYEWSCVKRRMNWVKLTQHANKLCLIPNAVFICATERFIAWLTIMRGWPSSLWWNKKWFSSVAFAFFCIVFAWRRIRIGLMWWGTVFPSNHWHICISVIMDFGIHNVFVPQPKKRCSIKQCKQSECRKSV